MWLAFLYCLYRFGCCGLGFHGNRLGLGQGVAGSYYRTDPAGNSAVLLADRIRGMPRIMAWGYPYRVNSPWHRPLRGMDPPMVRYLPSDRWVNVPMPVDMPLPQGMQMTGSVSVPVGVAVDGRRPVPVEMPVSGNDMTMVVGMPLFVLEPPPRRMWAMMPVGDRVMHTVQPGADYPVPVTGAVIAAIVMRVLGRRVHIKRGFPPALSVAAVHPALDFAHPVTVIDSFCLLVILFIIVCGSRQINDASRRGDSPHSKAARRRIQQCQGNR
jgi:hypothetical protein